MKVMYDETMMRIAEKRVRTKKEFYAHAITYVVVNTALMVLFGVIGITTGAGFRMIIPMAATLAGWGIGLVLHGVHAYTTVFSRPSPMEIQREYAKLVGDDLTINCSEAEVFDAPRHN